MSARSAELAITSLISNKRSWNNNYVLKNAPKILDKSSRLCFIVLSEETGWACTDNF